MTRSVIYKRIAICMLIGVGFGVVISEASYYFLGAGETRPPQVIEIVIPAGTAQLVSQGNANPSLPASMTFVVGDTVLVKNQDSVVHRLGPLFIPSGAAATLKLDSAQDYSVVCSFQPSKYIGLRVQPPLSLATRVLGVLEAGLPIGFLIEVYAVFAVPTRKPAPQ